MSSMIRAACGMGLVFAAPLGAATAGDELVWTRVGAPNGAFSIETPCSAGEVAAFRSVPNATLPISNYVPESRLICKRGGQVFMAGVVNTPDLPAGVSAYDYIVQKVAYAPGKPTETRIGGRRALINRQDQGATIGQTGFIELGPQRIITLVAGGRSEGAIAAASLLAIDRFYASIEVKG